MQGAGVYLSLGVIQESMCWWLPRGSEESILLILALCPVHCHKPEGPVWPHRQLSLAALCVSWKRGG